MNHSRLATLFVVLVVAFGGIRAHADNIQVGTLTVSSGFIASLTNLTSVPITWYGDTTDHYGNSSSYFGGAVGPNMTEQVLNGCGIFCSQVAYKGIYGFLKEADFTTQAGAFHAINTWSFTSGSFMDSFNGSIPLYVEGYAVSPPNVAEPASMLLVGLGLVLTGIVRKCRRD